jgi:hypothetical protein
MRKKTKVMIISRQPFPVLSMIDQIQPETVEYFSYLGSTEKLMQDFHGILNPVFSWQKQQQEYHFHQQTGKKFEEETSKLLHLENNFVWYWKLDTSEIRSEISERFCNVVLEKDKENQLNRSCKK